MRLKGVIFEKLMTSADIIKIHLSYSDELSIKNYINNKEIASSYLYDRVISKPYQFD